MGNLVHGLRDDQGRTNRRHSLKLGALALLGAICLLGYSAVMSTAVANNPIVLGCGEVKQYAQEFLAGTLSEELTEAVEGHLAHCPGCDRHIKTINDRVQNGKVEVASR